MLKAEGITYTYPNTEKPILENYNFSLEKGEILAVLGSNGAGKTTLIKTLLGLLPIQEGKVYFEGQRSYVPQSTLSPFAYSVKEMVVMGSCGKNGAFAVPNSGDYKRASEVLEQVGMEALINESFTHLSGGQKQLVLIARALASDPDIMILDEPTSSLDYYNQDMIMSTMSNISREGKIIIFSTHCPMQALHISHKVLLVKKYCECIFGKTREILNEENLSSLYNLPVSRYYFNKTEIVVPGYNPEARPEERISNITIKEK